MAIPHFLISIRNSLLPVPPAIAQPYPPPEAPVIPPPPTAAAPAVAEVAKVAEELSDHEASASTSEAGSEADVESNSSGVESSWIHA